MTAKTNKKFTGVWATFQYLDDFCDAISEIKKKGLHDLTTHSPCPRHEISHVLHDKPSRVPFFTLFMGILGTLTAFTLATWITLDWVLPVSNKPLISIPPFAIIMFELTVLFGAYGTAVGIITLATRDTKRKSFPADPKYMNYDRFMYDRYGLVVRCAADKFENLETILKEYHAEEIYKEK